MNLCDVNVLVYAHRADATMQHAEYKNWLNHAINSEAAFGISEAVLSGFVRVVTNKRIFGRPTTIAEALSFCDNLLNRDQCRILRPGPRNWSIFRRLCMESNVYGNLIPDAWLAALAIEYDCTVVTVDSDFSRFKSLKWRHPLA